MTTRYCPCGWLAAAELETCGHWLCELFLRGFGELELVASDTGWRHYLHGEPVSCGSSLLLCAFRWPALGDDGEREIARVLAPQDTPLPVRYESPLAQDARPPVLLYTDVAGHTALITAHSEMRLRWPHRGR